MKFFKTAVVLVGLVLSVHAKVHIDTDKSLYRSNESIAVDVTKMRKTKRCPDDPSQRKENNDCNWVGIFYAYDDDSAENLIAFAYAPGNLRDYRFVFPGLDRAGEYEARIFYRNNFKEKGFAPFQVKQALQKTTLKTSQAQYENDQDIKVHFTGFPGNSHDWIGIFSAYDDSTPDALLKKVETGGRKSGDVVLPALSAPGEYEVRAFFDGKFDEKYFYPFTVVEKPQPVTVCNYLQNPEFETDTKYWNVYGTHGTAQGYRSAKALFVRNGGIDQMTQLLPDHAETYQFHGFYKTSGKTDGIWAGLVFYDKDYHTLLSKDRYMADSSSYKAFTINATTPPGTRYAEVWIWSSAETHSGKLLIDGVRLSASGCYNYPVASALPPGNLSASQVPQFVVLGFDDNTIGEGIDWMVDTMQDKTNRDGSSARVSFYCNTVGMKTYHDDDPDTLLAAMQRLRESGNEIGDHTDDHMQHLNTDDSEDGFFRRIREDAYDDWRLHIVRARTDLEQLAGVNGTKIKGFRTPYLLYTTNSLKVLKAEGFLYDCSIEDGYSSEFDGTNFRWPYPLDGGSPGHDESWYGNPDNSEHVEIEPVAGLWELPLAPFMIPTDEECSKYGIEPGLWDRILERMPYLEDHKITGLDYQLWNMAALHPAEFTGILEYNLDLHLKGNHAPFMVGLHSQYYTDAWADDNAPNATADEMQAALSTFIDYALSKDAVRMTTGAKIIEWCRNPKAIPGQ